MYLLVQDENWFWVSYGVKTLVWVHHKKCLRFVPINIFNVFYKEVIKRFIFSKHLFGSFVHFSSFWLVVEKNYRDHKLTLVNVTYSKFVIKKKFTSSKL